MRLLPLFAAFGVALAASGLAFGAGPVRGENVEIELVSEQDAVVPGQPFTVALRISHDAGWNTQWSNSIQWILPEGFVAGPVRWPKPAIGYYGGGRLYTVTGEIFLFAEITPPASLPPETPVELTASMAWWAWQTDGGAASGASATLELPVAASPGADTPWAATLKAARAALPTTSPELSLTAYRKDQRITLIIDATRDLNPQAGKFTFFEDQRCVELGSDYVEWRTRRQVRISLRELERDSKPALISGLLQAERGWFPNGPELHAISGTITDGAPPPPEPFEPLAATVLRTLQSTTEYGKLRSLYIHHRDEGGEAWVKSVYGQRVRATVRRLHAEAASAATVDPEHPDKREVNFTSEGKVVRLTSMVPSLVDRDEIYRGGAGNILCRFILEQAQTDGLLPIPPLAPAAKDAIGRGIIAAQRSDYALAVRCFEEARGHSPRAPEVFLNLGLAEGKRPGRELRAIAWLGAYLTADPYAPAPNEAAVRAQMEVLFEKNQRNLATWLQGVHDAAARFTKGQWVALFQTVNMWVEAGEIAAAQKTAALIPPTDSDYSFSQHAILAAQIKRGDFSGAQKSADLIKGAIARAPADPATPSGYEGTKTEIIFTLAQVQTELAGAQVLAGDITGGKKTVAAAQKSAALIRYATYRCIVEPLIAEVLLNAGDRAGAEAVLAAARQTVEGNPEKHSTVRQLLSIARVQLLAGDTAGARQTFASAQDAAGLTGWGEFAEGKAEAQAAGGDLAGARATLALIGDKATGSPRAWDALARAQIKQGDFAGARVTALSLNREYEKSRVLLAIRAAEGQLGSTQREWLALLEDEDRSHPCPLNHAIFADFAGYIKSLGKYDDPRNLFEVQRAIAETQSRTKNALRQMVDALAKK